MDVGGESPGPGPQAPDLPEGWHVEHASGPPGFVTRMSLAAPDGRQYEWTSRRHRKRLGLSAASAPTGGESRQGRPDTTSWWLAALFGIGAVCFAVGSTPVFFNDVNPSVLAWTFFVGSLFFTSAGYLQVHECVTAPDGVLASPRRFRLGALLHWRPHRLDWWAAVIQFAGTLAFIVTTAAAFATDLSTEQEVRLIWAPDAVGSICFLVSSGMAWAEVNHGLRPRPDASVGWRIAALNMVGSTAFGAAAVAARYVPTTGEPANIALVNLGTFAGAICFLVGAVLLPVESARDAATPTARQQ